MSDKLIEGRFGPVEKIDVPAPTAKACSFCLKPIEVAKVLIFSPEDTMIGICDECVGRCVKTLISSALGYDKG